MQQQQQLSESALQREQEFKSGWPPPPFFYKEYSNGVNSGRQPPKCVKDAWKSFGQTYSRKLNFEELPADLQLYNSSPDIELKDEFKRLFNLYVKQVDKLLDSITNSRGDEGDHVKRLMKIYQNLMYLLFRMREHQTREAVINRLKQQIEERRSCIDALKASVSSAIKEFSKYNETLEKQ